MSERYPSTQSRPAGRVYLVGAGPGDPDLLTVKANRLLSTADVILHDSLTGNAIIDDIPEPTTIMNVGKTPHAGSDRWTQSEINQLMVTCARSDQTVVRLKGGDPTVFGRGGEEAEYLAAAGIPFEIVPGVSSIVAAPSIVGIPLTHRKYASSITIIPGYEDPSKEETAIEWNAVAKTVRAGGTLIILMGVRRLSENVQQLQAQGLPADTPVAMIEKATWPEERVITGTLETITEIAHETGIEPPAVTIVGEVVSLQSELHDGLEHGTLSESSVSSVHQQSQIPRYSPLLSQ